MKPKTKTTKETVKREVITVGNYQKAAMRTCLKTCKNAQYWGYGLMSETHELLGKVEGFYAKKIRGDEISKEKIDAIKEELGDCFWFIALGCALTTGKNKTTFEKVFNSAKPSTLDRMVICHVFDQSKISFMVAEKALVGWTSVMKSICAEFKIKPSDCLRANISKLSKRKLEGKIKGEGDDR